MFAYVSLIDSASWSTLSGDVSVAGSSYLGIIVGIAGVGMIIRHLLR